MGMTVREEPPNPTLSVQIPPTNSKQSLSQQMEDFMIEYGKQHTNSPTKNPPENKMNANKKVLKKDPPVCRFFLIGECKKGDSCPFLHKSVSAEIKSETVCIFHLKGQKCKYGSQCWFKHELPSPGKSELKADKPKLINEFNTKLKLAPKPSNKSYADSVNSSLDSRISKTICPSCFFDEECPNGDKCRYLHGLKCPHCGLNVIHPVSSSRKLDHLRECFKRADELKLLNYLRKSSVGKECGICTQETYGSTKFGLLPECQHSFCLECIIEWRNQTETFGKNVRSCPLCRQISFYVVPSKYFYDNEEEKKRYINNYIGYLKQTPCRNFDGGLGQCDFGANCFFKHESENGQLPQNNYFINPKEIIHFSKEYFEQAFVDDKSSILLHQAPSVIR